jgi:hypothetical protein
LENNYDQKIIKLLERSTTPMDVEKIRIDANIGNWNTALKHCLELLVSKKINGQKTSKSWVFWAISKSAFSEKTTEQEA